MKEDALILHLVMVFQFVSESALQQKIITFPQPEMIIMTHGTVQSYLHTLSTKYCLFRISSFMRYLFKENVIGFYFTGKTASCWYEPMLLNEDGDIDPAMKTK